MTTLTIGRLSATVHTGPEDVRSVPRVETMLGHLAERGLDDALRAVMLPPGEWYVRRLDLALAVDDDRPGSAVESRWATAVLDALRRALAGGSDVVHHRHPVDGLAELITALAAGRVDHAWVWRRAGLLRPGDAAPGSAPAQAVLAAVRRRPELACAALVAAVRAAGVPALHRLLGVRGWGELADVVRAAAGGTGAALAPLALPGAAGPGEEPSGTGARPASPHPQRAAAQTTGSRPVARDVDAGAPETVPPVRPPAPAALAAAVLVRSVLAEAFRRGRIRPVAEVALAWAVLVVAEADPGLLARPGAAAVLREIATVLAGTAPTALPVAGAARRTRPASPEPAAPEDAPAGPTASGSAAPAADDGGAPTGWAGLLFLLATAEEAGVPEALLDDPALAGRPLRWILAALAPRLLSGSPAPPAADDPAVLAFAGLVPTADPPHGPPPSPGEADSLDGHAHRWAVATTRRLARPDDHLAADPADVVTGMARRRGTVVAVPGWIELHLPLDDVDVDLRRAGLDLDPGWVPWLGAVVRYVYA